MAEKKAFDASQPVPNSKFPPINTESNNPITFKKDPRTGNTIPTESNNNVPLVEVQKKQDIPNAHPNNIFQSTNTGQSPFQNVMKSSNQGQTPSQNIFANMNQNMSSNVPSNVIKSSNVGQ